MDDHKKSNLIFFCLFCLLIIGGFYYLGEKIKVAEIYRCYYVDPPRKEPLVSITIKPECFPLNETNKTYGVSKCIEIGKTII